MAWKEKGGYTGISIKNPVTGRAVQLQLHVYLWLFENGLWARGETKTPDGHEIHHVDFDPQNNDITNLKLVTHSEHKKIHWDHDREIGELRRKKMSETMKKRYATQTLEQRRAGVMKAKAAALAKMAREGPTEKQVAAIARARTFAYDGKRFNKTVPKE